MIVDWSIDPVVGVVDQDVPGFDNRVDDWLVFQANLPAEGLAYPGIPTGILVGFTTV